MYLLKLTNYYNQIEFRDYRLNLYLNLHNEGFIYQKVGINQIENV